MNIIDYCKTNSKIKEWLIIKKNVYRDLEEILSNSITYNTSVLPIPSMAWEIDPIQNRFIILANKGIAIADTFEKSHTDATLFPENLFPSRGVIRDLCWYPHDNSLSSFLSNTGHFNLVDMNQMQSVDSFDLDIPSKCVGFDRTGNFPFCVSIGTKIGLRLCDLKSGSQIRLLKTKFDVECMEYSSKNYNEVFTGLSNGKTLLWDLRKSASPLQEIIHPHRTESPVRQISHSLFTNGSILFGYGNGDIVSVPSYAPERASWTSSFEIQTSGKNMFLPTSYGEVLYPNRGKIIFIDSNYGNVLTSLDVENLTSPSSVIMNEINNDIFIFDSNHIGTIFRFKPKKLYQENSI